MSGVVAELAELALVNLVDQVDDVTTEYWSADDYPLFDRLAINFDLLLQEKSASASDMSELRCLEQKQNASGEKVVVRKLFFAAAFVVLV